MSAPEPSQVPQRPQGSESRGGSDAAPYPSPTLTPEQAQALLTQATQMDATTRAGASWPQVAAMLSLGAGSTLALPAIAFAPTGLIVLPILFMMVWIVAPLLLMAVFSRSVKRGFGTRWVVTIGLWALIWVIGILGVSGWFAGELWFLVASCTALTAVTLVGAWLEARR